MTQNTRLTASQQSEPLIQLNEADEYFQSPIVVDSSPDSFSEDDSRDFCEKQINDILLESIDFVLSSLGEPVKNTVYIQLQAAFKIEKNEIPQNIAEFRDFMHQVLGSGFHRLERKLITIIDEKMMAKLGYCGESFLGGQTLGGVSLTEYVYSLFRFSLKL
jgi:hypothetical protein